MSVSNPSYVSEGPTASWYDHSTVAVLLYPFITPTPGHLHVSLL